MALVCSVEDCENLAVWSLPPYKAADHYCNKHYLELLCSDPDCDDPECRVHGREIRMYGSKR